jgi:Sulfotransferase domain
MRSCLTCDRVYYFIQQLQVQVTRHHSDHGHSSPGHNFMAPAHSAPYTGGLKVIGTGLGRTGTSSLKLALERLYGAKCYHMTEVIENGGPFGWFDFWTDVSAVRKPVGALLKRGTQYTDECTGTLTFLSLRLPGQGHHGAATRTHGRLRKHHRLSGALYLRPSAGERSPQKSTILVRSSPSHFRRVCTGNSCSKRTRMPSWCTAPAARKAGRKA